MFCCCSDRVSFHVPTYFLFNLIFVPREFEEFFFIIYTAFEENITNKDAVDNKNDYGYSGDQGPWLCLSYY